MTKNAWSGALLATVVAAAAPGCFYTPSGWGDFESESTWSEEWRAPESAAPVDVVNSRISGDMGEVIGVDGAATYEGGWGDADFATVDMRVRDTSAPFVMMSVVEITGGIDALEPGTRASFQNDDVPAYDPAALSVRVLGCSGPNEGEWKFDQYADRVDVEVSQGSAPGYVRVDYVAYFEWYSEGAASPVDQRAQGSFEVRR